MSEQRIDLQPKKSKLARFKMALSGYFNFEGIRVISHHSSTAIAAILFFGLVGWILKEVFHEGWVRDAIEVVDGIIIIVLFALLGIQLIRKIWKGGFNESAHSILAA